MPTYFATGSFEFSGKLSKKDVPDSVLDEALERLNWPRSHSVQLSILGSETEDHFPVNPAFFAPFDAYQVVVDGRDFTISFTGTLKIPSGGPFEGSFASIKKGEPVTFVLRRLVVRNDRRIVSTDKKPITFSMAVSKTKPKDVEFGR